MLFLACAQHFRLTSKRHLDFNFLENGVTFDYKAEMLKCKANIEKFSAPRYLEEDQFDEEEGSSYLSSSRDGEDKQVSPEKKLEPDSLDEEVIIQQQIEENLEEEEESQEDDISSFDEKYLDKKL